MPQMFTCEVCGNTISARLSTPWIISCLQCRGIVYQDPAVDATIVTPDMPRDWSFIQTGSTFQIDGQVYEVVGRIRLQLRNDYKNFWCAVQSSGTFAWLMESFASSAVLSGNWRPSKKKAKTLQAGSVYKIPGEIQLTGEYVEKCEALSIEGEIGEWPLLKPGFFFMQGSNNSYDTAVFTVDDDHDIAMLQGKKADIDQLKLTNIVAWNEWK